MNRIVIIVAAALLLYAGIFATPAFAFDATVDAHSVMGGLFPPPNPRTVNSGFVSGMTEAQASDSFSYTAPHDLYTVGGNQSAGALMGSFWLFSKLTAQSDFTDPAISGTLWASFLDQVTVYYLLGSSYDPVAYWKFSSVMNGSANGYGTYSGKITLDIDIINGGSRDHPKNLTYKKHMEKSWSDAGYGSAASRPDTVPGDDGDVMMIHAVVVLSGSVTASYVGSGSSGMTSDFAHTIHFYIDSLTPGATLTAASGHDYASPKTAVDRVAWTLYE